jgi:IS1 family transposase/lambda repressor-like predicted transcriptional regulator
MNKLPLAKRVLILSALAEGNSMRSTSRMAGVSINTVVKLLIEAGRACACYQHEKMRNLVCARLQIDEIWSYCYAKQKNVPANHEGEFGYGDIWTFTAIDADTKLVLCWMVGWRDVACATEFVKDLAARLARRIQLTTDGHKMYLQTVEDGFGSDIDCAMLVKTYGNEPAGEARYSPPKCNGAEKHKITGNPNLDEISTSYVERQNLSMRMGMGRFTRLTNAFSKKLANLEHAVALHFFHYNFIRNHTTLRRTTAMAAGIADHRWTMEDLIAMMERVSENENSN